MFGRTRRQRRHDRAEGVTARVVEEAASPESDQVEQVERRWVVISDNPGEFRVSGPDCPVYTELMPVSEHKAEVERLKRDRDNARGAAEKYRDQREEAHHGEDRFKAHRDSALALLRWLIGDLIPVIPDDEELHPGVCRECGCTPERACWHEDFGGCGWAEPGLCTACTPDAGPGWRHPVLEVGDGELLCGECRERLHSTLTDQCPHCGAENYGQLDRRDEELTMIALALKNQGIEDVTPERGVELLIERLYNPLDRIGAESHEYAKTKGFWDRDRIPLPEDPTEPHYAPPRTVANPSIVPEKLALAHSELSEALEALRDEDLEHFEEELADALIRILDIAAYCGLSMDRAVAMKTAKNRERPRLHGRSW